MKIDYNDCLNYIQNTLKVKLYDYQKIMLQAFCTEKTVKCCRGCGRTYVSGLVGKYVAHILDNQDTTHCDIAITYHAVIHDNPTSETYFKDIRESLSPEKWKEDFDI